MHALEDWSPPRLVNGSEDRPQLCRLIFPPSAIDLASSCEKPIHVPKDFHRGLFEKQRALGLSVVQPNPSVANLRPIKLLIG